MSTCRFCSNSNPAGVDRCQKCGSWLEQTVASASSDEQSGELSPQAGDWQGQVVSLAKQGQMIAAIKLYREETGAGLAEAKSAVEAMAAGRPVERRSPAADGVTPESLEGQILGLMQGQKKIEAIKLYRKQTGLGLKEAKDAVETLGAKYGINPKGAGCAGMVLFLAIASTILGLGVWRLAG